MCREGIDRYGVLLGGNVTYLWPIRWRIEETFRGLNVLKGVGYSKRVEKSGWIRHVLLYRDLHQSFSGYLPGAVRVEIGAKGRGLQRGSRIGKSAVQLLVGEHSGLEHGQLLKNLGVLNSTSGYPVSPEEFALVRMASTKSDVDLEDGARARGQGHRQGGGGLGAA